MQRKKIIYIFLCIAVLLFSSVIMYQSYNRIGNSAVNNLPWRWGYELNEIPFSDYMIPFVLMAGSFSALFMLFSPIKIVKECFPFEQLTKVKIEILVAFYVIASPILMYFLDDILRETYSGGFNATAFKFGVSDIIYIIKPLSNIGLWFLFFFFLIFLIYMIKYIIHIGVKNYIQKYSLSLWLYQMILRIIDRILKFDLKENSNKIIISIVILNFMIISVICIFYIYGFLLAILYSIILFVFLRKKFKKIQNDYKVLLVSMRRISNGDFNSEINEDLGMFQTLGDEFNLIRDGFEKAVNEEVKSQRMKTELISNVSHDLKTPLTTIITYVDLLKKEDLTEAEQKKFIGTLDRNTLRLKTLIEDLFEVTKANTGNIQLDMVNVDIVALMSQVQFECLDAIDAKDLDFRVNATADKMILSLDSAKTYRVFENLVTNICKYAMKGTRVYIDIIDQENSVYIAFKNMSESEIRFDINEIAERFVQGDKSRNDSGAGLGLAIAKSFTEIQNGTLKIEVDGDLFKAIIEFQK